MMDQNSCLVAEGDFWGHLERFNLVGQVVVFIYLMWQLGCVIVRVLRSHKKLRPFYDFGYLLLWSCCPSLFALQTEADRKREEADRNRSLESLDLADGNGPGR